MGAWLKDAVQGRAAAWLREGVLSARPALGQWV